MRKISRTHIVLFVLTCLSTLAAGAIQKGVHLIEEPLRIIEGLPFSFTLMAILLSHELSHYFASRAHKTEATLPYFIPAPPVPLGTFGAFIKMTSPIANRKALIDIGASGPIVGFAFSVIASIIGLSLSEVIVVPEGGGIEVGNSLIFSFLSNSIIGAVPEGSDILLHPIATAGWIGLFVTTLNLIPVGQLDGGHIAYALLGPLHRKVSAFLVGVLFILGLSLWPGWVVWAVLMLVLGLRHPPVVHWETPLDPSRRKIGWGAVVIFILTFTPAPFPFSLLRLLFEKFGFHF